MTSNAAALNGMENSDTPDELESCLRLIKSTQAPVGWTEPRSLEGPLASILICSFNRPFYLAALLEQLKFQTYANFEIIIVGGPDPSIHSPKLPPATFFSPSPVRSLGMIRNQSVLLSRGSILIFIDDDSYVAEDFVERHVWLHLQRDGDRMAAWQGHCLGAPHDRRGNGWVQKACAFQPQGTILATLHTTNCSIKRKLLQSIGGFNNTLRFTEEDSELGGRFHAFGYLIGNAPEVVSIHRGAGVGGARPTPEEFVQRMAGQIADAGLARVSLQKPIRGTFSVGKNLLKIAIRNPWVLTRHFSIILSESAGYFWRHVNQNLPALRQKHLEMAEKLHFPP